VKHGERETKKEEQKQNLRHGYEFPFKHWKKNKEVYNHKLNFYGGDWIKGMLKSQKRKKCYDFDM
jgi:hypothetical protein